MTKQKFTKRVLVIGIPDMAYIGVDTLHAAGVNIVGVVGPKKTHGTYPAFRNFILSKNLNFIEYETLNSPELHEEIKKLNIDIAVVFSFNDKLPKTFIDLIPNGIINLHPSLLPKYRGGNPYSRVIMNGETETGITLHFISENFDEGDIITQIKCPLDEKETMGTLFIKTNYLGVRLVLSALIEFEKKNQLPRIPQPQGEFIEAKNLKNEEYYINFNMTAIEIERLIRAVNPFLTCYTYFKGQLLKIHKATVEKCDIPDNTVNGEIIKVTENNVFIKTKEGAICPKVVQYGSYFTGDIEDFIRIAQPNVGEIMGNG